MLGFVGLGLAVLGTVLACIPAVFGIGVVVLVAAFVVSFIGLFRKGAAKWPSIVGLRLVVAGQDPLASERESAGQAIIDATLACDPQP
ncbi:hypothetical protein [Microbacterium hydrocarbonoxydans]|uniref:hypothetical protein n=1 Tax=Microbacterium hydrocarbonoxydans TaxID=273678 RepID=UPI003D966383